MQCSVNTVHVIRRTWHAGAVDVHEYGRDTANFERKPDATSVVDARRMENLVTQLIENKMLLATAGGGAVEWLHGQRATTCCVAW